MSGPIQKILFDWQVTIPPNSRATVYIPGNDQNVHGDWFRDTSFYESTKLRIMNRFNCKGVKQIGHMDDSHGPGSCGCTPKKPAQKLVVLTFDDAVRSHLEYVAPMLKEKGFGATFFVCDLWMRDTVNFLQWDEVGELHQDGI